MKPIAKTDFSAMSSAELAATDDILEITSVKTVVGFFVPSDIFWEWYNIVYKEALAREQTQPDAGQGEG